MGCPRPNRLLVLRRFQRGNMGIRILDPGRGAELQGLVGHCGDGVHHHQRSHQLERCDRRAVPCPLSRAGEGELGVLGQLCSHCVEGDSGHVLVCNSDGQWWGCDVRDDIGHLAEFQEGSE